MKLRLILVTAAIFVGLGVEPPGIHAQKSDEMGPMLQQAPMRYAIVTANDSPRVILVGGFHHWRHRRHHERRHHERRRDRYGDRYQPSSVRYKPATFRIAGWV